MWSDNRRDGVNALVSLNVALAVASVGAEQIDAGLLASVHDREITVSYDAGANRTEALLSVVPSGTGGQASGIALFFVGEFAGRTPAPGRTNFSVRAHITVRSDSRERDPRTGADGKELILRLDPHTESGITLYLFARSWGYAGFVAPGGEIPVAFFALTAAELRALSTARAITGRALGSEFILAPDHLTALGEFAKRYVR